MASDFAQLQRDIRAQQQAYLGFRDKLQAALAPFNPPEDACDHLLSVADEFGAAHAVKALGDDPKHFGMELPPEVRGEVAPLLLSIVDTSHRLDALVGEREDIMAKIDPSRRRIHMHFGREAVIDTGDGTITYVDDPDHPLPLNIDLLHTKDQPAPGRQAPSRIARDDKEPPTR